jgi:hypothetical protein
MIQFTIRELIALPVVGGISCLLAIFAAPADPISSLIAAVGLFVFGMTCYAVGVVVGGMRAGGSGSR